MKHVIIYTDGACKGNPDGPGGYGVVLLYRDKNNQVYRKEISGGFANTTNNRMEIMAAIVGLEALKEPCKVTLFSDSQYLVNAIEKKWVKRWQMNGWMRDAKKGIKAKNIDLWKRLLDAMKEHEVTFKWVRGHAGDPENERCDTLATEAANQSDLPLDSREDN
ncbi:MAG: ribonuclease [Clostridia bacterium]|jgi:ribonuclease HI|nr:ribonuclease [Clostridiales bacterium]MDK2984501.1 ribonuclease [Clostridia bacterium]